MLSCGGVCVSYGGATITAELLVVCAYPNGADDGVLVDKVVMEAVTWTAVVVVVTLVGVHE